jgi:hypothetical protein
MISAGDDGPVASGPWPAVSTPTPVRQNSRVNTPDMGVSLGAGRCTQLSLQKEVLAPGRRLGDRKIEPARQPGPDGQFLDRSGEPIPDARQGQHSLAIGRTQSLAQLCDCVGENVLDGTRPAQISSRSSSRETTSPACASTRLEVSPQLNPDRSRWGN